MAFVGNNLEASRPRRPARSIRRLVCAGVFVVMIFGFGHATSSACDRPVYRYAMTQWNASPYRIYFVHEDPVGMNDRLVAARIATASNVAKQQINIEYQRIRLDDGVLPNAPKTLQSIWNDGRKWSTPCHFVLSPTGKEIFSGRLSPDEVRQLLDSPARHQITTELLSGKAAVLVLLTGTREKANLAAERIVVQTVTAINGRTINLEGAKTSKKTRVGDEGKGVETKPRHQVGFVKLSRTDPRERWLARMLLAIAPKSDDEWLNDRPMVFTVYGRGKVLPPHIGEGVNRKHLTKSIELVTGTCACQVKVRDSGNGLLLRCDWSKATGNGPAE